MSSKIPGAIPERNFEIIRNKIVSILTDEFAGQFAITSNALFQSTIYKERFIAFDKTELPAVLVYFSRNNSDEKTPRSTRGTSTFSIEVHTKAAFTSSQRGDTQASLDCDKLLGAIQYILSSPYYYALELNSIVSSTNVDSYEIGRSSLADGAATVVGIISFSVKHIEDNGVIASTAYEGADATLNEDIQITVNKT